MPYYNPHHGSQTLMADIHQSNYAMFKSIMGNQRVEIAELKCLLGIEDGALVDVQAEDIRQKLGQRSSRVCLRDYSLSSSETEYNGDDRSVASNNTIETIEIAPDHDEAKQQASDSGLVMDADSESDLVEDVPATVEVKRIIHWAMGSALEDRMIQIQDSRDKDQDGLSAQPKSDGTADVNKEADVELDYFSAKSNRITDGGEQKEPTPPAIPNQSESEGSAKDPTTTSVAGQDPPHPRSNSSSPAAGDDSAAGAQAAQAGDNTAARRVSWRQRRKEELRRFKQAWKDSSCFGGENQPGDNQPQAKRGMEFMMY